jgi:hypothetical protein
MPPKFGFRIIEGVRRPPADMIDAFRGKAAANLADAMGRFHFMDPGIVSRTRKAYPRRTERSRSCVDGHAAWATGSTRTISSRPAGRRRRWIHTS